MNWILHNPLADLPGPSFLLVYAFAIAGTFLFAWFYVRGADATRDLPTPPIPQRPDPYAMAWLRGDVQELSRIVIFDLLEKGYLRQVEKKNFLGVATKSIGQASPPPDLRQLNLLQRRVFDWFRQPRKPESVFRDRLPESLDRYAERYETYWAEQQLIPADDLIRARNSARVAGLAAILGLGGYKFTVAMIKGHFNVEYLVIMATVSSVGLVLLLLRRRTSDLGKRYLNQLQLAFADLRTRAAETNASDTADPQLLLACGIFGVGALAKTRYAFFHEMFQKSAGMGGCGSAAGCGSGCGGGCGGGGCGGCGG